jgi:hypothetical protein
VGLRVGDIITTVDEVHGVRPRILEAA